MMSSYHALSTIRLKIKPESIDYRVSSDINRHVS